MENFVQRENGFLGYSSHQGLSNNSPKKPNDGRLEDMDFNDVFGGPPRRFSIQEVNLRHSFVKTEESAEETVISSPWSSLNQKPVFGEDSVPKRQHPQGDDFFDDIFRGEECYGSPRRTELDWDSAFRSSPGSRILSPALPRKAEPFGTSVPAQFSLQAESTKGLEIPTFSTNGQCKIDSSTNGLNSQNSSISAPRFPSQVIRSPDENLVYRQSPLSHRISRSQKDLPSMAMSDQKENVDTLQRDRRNVDIKDNQFHFSIYKWAGREVPMPLPLMGKARDGVKCDRSASSNGRIGSNFSSYGMKNLGLSAASSKLLNTKVKTEDLNRAENMKKLQEEQKLYETLEVKPQIIAKNKVVQEKNEKEESLKKEESFSLRFELKPLHDAFIGDENNNVKEKTGKQVPLKREASIRFELKSLHTGSDEIDVMKKTVESVCLNKEEPAQPEHNKPVHIVNKNEETRVPSNKGITDKSSLQAAGVNVRVTAPQENGAKGKVREFVQIFNKEADSRPAADLQRRSQSCRWKAVDTAQKENGMSTDPAAEVEEKLNLHNVAKNPDVSTKVEENLNKDDAQQRSHASYTSRHSSANHKNGFASERFRRDSKIYTEIFYDSLEGDFLVQELPDDNENITQSEDLDDTEVIDAKIRQWSYGKKGNIRSLLSTLQFVLWPESGWKSVPLADLIETNSVKRAYQKALLRLHPDKLQQKGAAFHQKYIAAKVFDILQEAWDQFNALVPL